MAIGFCRERRQTVKENARKWWAGELDRPLVQFTLSGADSIENEDNIRAHMERYGVNPEEDMLYRATRYARDVVDPPF